ncbi:EF hand [Novosphingobium sp. CF614]|uniref:hypothetical protein n=1 Tax=Novosphingobium sp. CF614 TaxID=1884364 RepID=UPI0008F1C727|nr:hypothetical protein [Novosphingobium sp. CF614]SFG42401.1 EF hand [Novosphingobium sp. CF614]
MKTSSLAIVAAVLALGACSGEPVPQETQTGVVDASEAAVAPEGGPPMGGDTSKNPDMTQLAAEVDADGNGELSRAEWQAQGLPESSFNMFEKGRGFVTLQDYQENAAPPGIDINGDGTLTIEEFKTFDKQMSAQMKAGPPPQP